MTSHIALMPNRLVKTLGRCFHLFTLGTFKPEQRLNGKVSQHLNNTGKVFKRNIFGVECEDWVSACRFSPSFLIFYYSEDLIGVENIFLNLNRSRMLIASKLTLFSCQNSSKSFHAAEASCTNMRHLPKGNIRFHLMQGPCGSHKLIEVMLTKRREGRKCQPECGHLKSDCDVALFLIKGAVFGHLAWNWTLVVF